jgi:hypothetical protein
MSSTTSAAEVPPEVQGAHSQLSEEVIEEVKQEDAVLTSSTNLIYLHEGEEPELHAWTYFAVAAMFLLNMVQVLALQGPPAVVSKIFE